jgi:hypothetical protein
VSQCLPLGYGLHPTILQSPKCFSDLPPSHPQSLAQPPPNQSIPLHTLPLKMHLLTLLATIPLITLTLAWNSPPPPPQNTYTTDCSHPPQNATCGTSTVPVTSNLCDSGLCTCDANGTLVCPDLNDLCTGEMLQAVCLASFECSCVIVTDPCSGFPGCGVGPGHGL